MDRHELLRGGVEIEEGYMINRVVAGARRSARSSLRRTGVGETPSTHARVRLAGALVGALALGSISVVAATASVTHARRSAVRGAACAGLAHAKKQLAFYSKVPKFTAPGPAVNVSKLKGQKIYLIPATSAIPFNQLLDATAMQAAKAAGVDLTVYNNQGQPSQWVQGINQAIAAHAKALILTDIDVRTIGPQMTALRKAHIPVIVDSLYDRTDTRFRSSQVAASVPSPYHLAGQLVADGAIAKTNCNAHIVYIQDPAYLNFQYELPGVQSELKKYCPACTIHVMSVPYLDWATKLQGEVTSALLSTPNANWVSPGVDGMWANVSAGVNGAKKRVGMSSFNGTPFVLDDMRKPSGFARIYSDAGESLAWKAYATLDQTFRVLLGMKPVAENTPIRVFTAANVTDAGVPATYTKGFGNAYASGYLKLWGVHK
jgi:ribose transport system substrate-binding protein